MPLNNTKTGWGLISKTLHWLIALLIILTAIVGIIADETPLSPAKLNLYIYHKSLGITVLLAVIVRLLWKGYAVAPNRPSGLNPRQHHFARLGHYALYALMIALPFSGFLLNSAANIPFKWMHQFSVPLLTVIDQHWQDPLAIIHKVFFISLTILVIGHIAMAIYHHLRDDSDVLRRMLPNASPLVISVLLFVSVILFSWFIDTVTSNADVTPLETSTISEEQAVEIPLHTQQRWLVSPADSKLAFVGRYDGVEFHGEFRQFTANLYFDAQEPENGFFDVSIESASVTTYTDDWDQSLPDTDWFSTELFPQAFFTTTSFEASDKHFTAYGIVEIKGIRKPVSLDFQWSPRSSGKVDFTAKAVLNRTDFDVGAGVWATDPTIGFEVTVLVELLLSPAPNH